MRSFVADQVIWGISMPYYVSPVTSAWVEVESEVAYERKVCCHFNREAMWFCFCWDLSDFHLTFLPQCFHYHRRVLKMFDVGTVFDWMIMYQEIYLTTSNHAHLF